MTLREKIEGLAPIMGTQIPPECISDRWLAGDSIDALAADYELSREVIEDSIRLVLRTIAEHEQENAALRKRVSDLERWLAEAGGGPLHHGTLDEDGHEAPIGHAGGEPYRPMSSVGTGLRAVHEVWEDMAGDIVRVFAPPDRLVRPRGATWAEVAQMARRQEPAEVPRWRKELGRLRGLHHELARANCVGEVATCRPEVIQAVERVLPELERLVTLHHIIASGRGQAGVPRDLVRRLFALWAYDYTATREGDYVRLRCAERHTTSVSVEIFMRELDLYGDSLCGAP